MKFIKASMLKMLSEVRELGGKAMFLTGKAKH